MPSDPSARVRTTWFLCLGSEDPIAAPWPVPGRPHAVPGSHKFVAPATTALGPAGLWSKSGAVQRPLAGEESTMPTDAELVELEARREQLRQQYLLPTAERPSTPGRGIHHAALICSNVEQTIQFYQGLLGFPLVHRHGAECS